MIRLPKTFGVHKARNVNANVSTIAKNAKKDRFKNSCQKFEIWHFQQVLDVQQGRSHRAVHIKR